MWNIIFVILVCVLLIFILFVIFKETRPDPQIEMIKFQMSKLCDHIKRLDNSNPIDLYLWKLCSEMPKLKWKVNYRNTGTSFTTNKSTITLCLRSKETGARHSDNLLIYVALHELAHVACSEKGHTQLFKNIFKRLVHLANEAGIYQIEDYQNNPIEYCGMQLHDCDRCLVDGKNN
jgi:predicted SprT family Zn-dependent metalloprotease